MTIPTNQIPSVAMSNDVESLVVSLNSIIARTQQIAEEYNVTASAVAGTGELTDLETTAKTNVVSAINSLRTELLTTYQQGLLLIPPSEKTVSATSYTVLDEDFNGDVLITLDCSANSIEVMFPEGLLKNRPLKFTKIGAFGATLVIDPLGTGTLRSRSGANTINGNYGVVTAVRYTEDSVDSFLIYGDLV